MRKTMSDRHNSRKPRLRPFPTEFWGSGVDPRVQTERAGHEAWAQLIAHAPRAAQLLHILVANMDKSGALIASQATLAKPPLAAASGKTASRVSWMCAG